MALKKIQLQFLWADEGVMSADLVRNISSGMTEWGNKFYKQFEFQFDVQPNHGNPTVLNSMRFALKKNDGISPDFDWLTTISKKFDRLEKPYDLLIDEKNKEIVDIRRALATKQAEWDQKDAERNALTVQLNGTTDPGQRTTIMNQRTAVVLQIAANNTEQKNLVVRLIAALDAINAAQKAKAALSQKRTSELANGGDFENTFRSQMRDLFLTRKIGDEKRINVVFCSFKKSSEAVIAIGMTYMQIGALVPGIPSSITSNLVLTKWLWPYPFIIIDIEKARPWTLAHEVVHAAGHHHPVASRLKFVLEKRVRVLKLGPGRSLLTATLDTEEVGRYVELPGGFFDGADNDIMNDSFEGPNAEDGILNDADKQLLNDARFVVP